jgi:hypothetical protein
MYTRAGEGSRSGRDEGSKGVTEACEGCQRVVEVVSRGIDLQHGRVVKEESVIAGGFTLPAAIVIMCLGSSRGKLVL